LCSESAKEPFLLWCNSYRVDAWDVALRRYLNQLQATKPVLLTGDLNVAHLDLDIYNYFAPHVKKTPGCTQEERQSMTTMLEEVRIYTRVF
jgi:exonuclease III